MKKQRRSRQSGQVLVMVVGGMIALIAATGFVVDAGFAFAEQRSTQNSADSASRAGAVVLARRAADPTTLTDAQWDEEVRNAVLNASLVNKTTVLEQRYTDWQGAALPGNPAVGSGGVPPDAAGVRVVTQKRPGTYLIRVVGFNAWDIRQEATSVSGPTAACIEVPGSCILLPITFPVTVYECALGNTSVPLEQAWDPGQEITLPLCGGNPGSVGWIDWDPPSGGTDEIVDDVKNPPAVSVPLPSWKYITQTGGLSSAPLEGALNAYIGQTVQVPFFDSTCQTEPVGNEIEGCSEEGGTGVGQWYHIPKILSFKLTQAYTNGDNRDICGEYAQQCLVGSFVSFITQGTVGAPCVGTCPFGTTFAVQLIK